MKIQVCSGMSCQQKQSSYVYKRIENDIVLNKYEDITLETCLCLGNCKKSPNLRVDGKILENMNPIEASKYLKKLF